MPTVPPYVLPCDKPILDRYAPKLTGEAEIRLDTLAYPYLGNPETADVLLLALNGGFKPEVLNYLQADPIYVEQRRKSLTFESDYPFFYLDPRFASTAGHQWWRRRLSYFVERQGLKSVAEKFACVQWFPYCSARFKALPQLLPSQEYSFDLVRQAIKDGKEIVLMRSREKWRAAVPELKDYPYIELKFPRTTFVAKNHMTDEQFKRLEQAVQA